MSKLNVIHESKSAPESGAAQTERIDVPVTGMSCAACARRVERGLAETPGVRRASVNFATSRATVDYDPATTDNGTSSSGHALFFSTGTLRGSLSPRVFRE